MIPLKDNLLQDRIGWFGADDWVAPSKPWHLRIRKADASRNLAASELIVPQCWRQVFVAQASQASDKTDSAEVQIMTGAI